MAALFFGCGGEPGDDLASPGEQSDSNEATRSGGSGSRSRDASESFDTHATVSGGSDAAIERGSSSSESEPEASGASDDEKASAPSASTGTSDTETSAAAPQPQLATDVCPSAVGSGEDGLIDDLEDGDNVILAYDGRSGYWYTYNDGSGFQTPLVGTPFEPGYEGASGSKRSAATFGYGFSGWGAGVGFDLTNISRCPYDASAYTGLAFEAKGNVTIRARVAIKDTIETSQGGACSAMPADDCNNAHGVDVALSSSWTRYQIAFVDLKQEDGWGIPTKFNAKQILKIQFQVKSTNPDQQGIPDFNYAIDNVTFY